MDCWTSITIIAIVVVLGSISYKAATALQAKKSKEIDDLKQRLNELEKTSNKRIEKRVRALESIVVDGDYLLSMKFKELMEDAETKVSP